MDINFRDLSPREKVTTIQIDTREKKRAIRKIRTAFKAQGIKTIDSKLFVGDYVNLDNYRMIVDRKQNLSEVYNNVCHDKTRFHNELKKAKGIDAFIYFLVEHGEGIKDLEDVKKWKNPQLDSNPYAWDGFRLYNELRLIQATYDCKFLFCNKDETGKKIIELLA